MQTYTNNASIQDVLQTTSGTVHNGVSTVFDSFAFPLAVNVTSLDGGNITEVVIDHSYNRDLLPLPIMVRSNIQERQLAIGIFVLSPRGMGLATTHSITSTKPGIQWSMQPLT